MLHNKELVAVKILRPNISKVINRDTETIKILAKIIKIFDKFLAKFLVEISNLLIETSISELDLLKEAANGSKLKEDLKNISETLDKPIRDVELFLRKEIEKNEGLL